MIQYSITFTRPEYFYGNGALYHRADFSKEIETGHEIAYSQRMRSMMQHLKKEGRKSKTARFHRILYSAYRKSRFMDNEIGFAALTLVTSGPITYVFVTTPCSLSTARLVKRPPEPVASKKLSDRD